MSAVLRTPKAKGIPAGFLFGLSLAYLHAFLRLGWFLQDEGYLYYQYLRAFRGQVPYRDFFTAYGPVTLWLHAALFSFAGVSIHTARVFLEVLHGISAVCLYAIARRFTTAVPALVPPLLFLTMQPGDISDMAFHNTPYPLWYAVFLTVIGTWVTLRSLEARTMLTRGAWLALSGFIGGMMLLTKQNSGVFFLWGVSGFLFSHPGADSAAPQAERRYVRRLRRGYLSLLPLAALYLIHRHITAATLAFFVMPLALLAWIGAHKGFGPAAWRRLRRDVAVVVFGFLVAVLPWFIHVGRLVGLDIFLRALLFVGVDPEHSLYRPHPVPRIPTWIALNVLVAATIYALLRRRRCHDGAAARHVLGSLRAGGVALAALLPAVWLAVSQWRMIRLFLHVQDNPWEVCWFGSTAVDNLIGYASPIILIAGIVVGGLGARAPVPAEGTTTDSFHCLLWLAACTFAAYYPRMDAAHLFAVAPLVYVLGVALPARLGRALLRSQNGCIDEGRLPAAAPSFPTSPATTCGTRAARVTARATCALLLVLAAGLKLAPKVYSRVMLARSGGHLRLAPTPVEELRFGRADVYFPVYKSVHRLRVESFRNMITHVQESLAADEPLFVFPALAMTYFVSERDNPTRHDYFLGSNVRFDEQLEIIRTLERERVKLVVVPSDRNDYFLKSCRPYTRLLADYLRQNYYLERRLDKYDVLRRYGTERREGFDGPES